MIYLEAALCDLTDADDVDFVSNASQFLDEIQRIAPGCLSKWYLNINQAKAERTNIHRRNNRAGMTRNRVGMTRNRAGMTRNRAGMTRKLSSLLGYVQAGNGVSNLRLWLSRSRVLPGSDTTAYPKTSGCDFVQCVYSPCAHIQHGNAGINANGMDQV